MSFPIFKDFDKSVSEIFSDDFDSKYTLKIKSAGPLGVAVTTNTAYDASKDSKLSTKISSKWAHGSGFTLEKLELANDGRISTETSLSGAAKGLKLEFKGNDSDKGDLSFTFNHPLATFTGDFDALTFKKANASVSSGHGPVSVGASVDLLFAKSAVASSTIGAGLGYSLDKTLFVRARANKNFSEYSGLVSYKAAGNLTLAGSVAYSPKGTTGIIGTVYKCNPDTTIKIKAASSGVINASVKQSVDKKLTVTGSVEVPSTLSGFKFGVNAALG